MEYQNIIYFLDNTPNKWSKFRPKISVEINDDSCGTYKTNSQTKSKTSMLKSSLCGYSDAYILANGPRKIKGGGEDQKARQLDERNKEVIFEKFCIIQ